MTKIVLLALLLCVGGTTVSAQVLFYESFDNIGGPTAGGAGTYSFPQGWLLRNVDNRTPDAQVSYVNQAWERREDFNFNVMDSAVFSTSYYSPLGSADDWMWTPAISLPASANLQLSWQAVTYDPNYRDGYEVRIMTGTIPTGGTGVIGNQVTASSVLMTVAAENSNWTTRQVSLNTYAGQTVYIGFRNNSNDKFLLLIDDVKVERINDFNATITAAGSFEYPSTPLAQTSLGIGLSATLKNNGGANLSNVTIKAHVYNSAGLMVQTITSAATSTVTPASSITPVFTKWMPTDTGTYTVRYVASHSQSDDFPSDDTLISSAINITQKVFARDNGIVNGSLGIGAGNGYMGQSFTLSTPAFLSAVISSFTRGYTGRPYAAVIWDTDASGTPQNIIAATDTLLYPGNDAFTDTIPIFGGTKYLTAGKYVVTAIEFDSTLAIALASGVFTNGSTYVKWSANPNWSHNETFGTQFAKSYMLRLYLDEVSNVLYVDSSNANPGIGNNWANALTRLSDAFEMARQYSFVDSILVAKGTYYPTGEAATVNRDSVFLVRQSGGIVVLGGYAPGGASRNIVANATLLSGDLGAQNNYSDNSYHVLAIVGTDAIADSVIIDGFKIVHGNASGVGDQTLNGLPAARNSGGGVFLTDNNNNNKIHFRNCTIAGNKASGYSGGIAFFESSSPVLSNCLIKGNHALISAAMNTFKSSPTLINCTFSGNYTTGSASGCVYNELSSPLFRNCIVYGNSGGIINNPSVTYSLVQGLAAAGGTNNIDGNTDAMFVNAPAYGTAPFTNGDYRLRGGSLCINAANNAAIATGVDNDITGGLRVVDGVVDMGCYELQHIYYSSGNHAAGTPPNWKVNSDGSGASATALNILSRFVVQAGDTVSVTGTVSMDSATLVLQNNSRINNAGDLLLGDILDNDGSIAGNGTATLNGTMGKQFIRGVGIVHNLAIDNAAGVEIATNADTVKLTGVLTPISGTFTTKDNLWLLSDANSTGAIAAGSGSYLSGAVTLQRFLTAQRAYRLLGHPLNVNVPLSSLQPYIDITGSTAGGLTSGNSSAFHFLSGAAWQPYTANSQTWNLNEALLVFVRGVAGQGIGQVAGTYTPTAPTLQLSGVVNTGNIDYVVKSAASFGGAAEGWNAVGNPYPAPIDVNSVGNINLNGNATAVYVWNASKGSTAAGIASGGYDFYTLGSPIVLPQFGAFFIMNTAAANEVIHFTESCKATAATPLGVLKTSHAHQGFILALEDEAGVYWDKLKLSFAKAANAGFGDRYDLKKMNNILLDFYSIGSDSSKLAINHSPLLQPNTAIPLVLNTARKQNFILRAVDVNLSERDMDYYLHDKHKQQWVKINEGMKYLFEVTDEPATKGPNRFEVVAKVKPVESRMVSDITIGPNPASDLLYITASGESYVRVMNAAGTVVISLKQKGDMLTVPVKHLPAGLYFVEVESAGTRVTEKILKR